MISIDELWNIVPYPQMAHFVIEYKVDLMGRDKAFIIVRSRDGVLSFAGFRRSSSESILVNKGVARDIYLKDLYPVIIKMEKGKIPENFRQFIIE